MSTKFCAQRCRKLARRYRQEMDATLSNASRGTRGAQKIRLRKWMQRATDEGRCAWCGCVPLATAGAEA